MNDDQDFGNYRCAAYNGLTAPVFKAVEVEQISKCCFS